MAKRAIKREKIKYKGRLIVKKTFKYKLTSGKVVTTTSYFVGRKEFRTLNNAHAYIDGYRV